MNKILGIAINDYSDTRLNNLSNCLNDVNEIISLLKNKYNFDDDDVELLSSLEQTNKSNLFNRLQDNLINSLEEDNILIIYAGHGERNNILDSTYWLPSDARGDDVSTWLNVSDIISFLKASKAKHISLIVDSCFSGAIMADNTRGGGFDAFDNKKSRLALASGGFEKVSDGAKNDLSPFAKIISEILNENTESKLSFLNFSEKVILNFNQERFQTPMFGQLPKTGHQGGSFIFELKENNLNPNNIGNFYQLASNYKELGNIEKAIEMLEELIKIEPNSKDSFRLLGEIYAEKGETDNSIKYFTKYLSINLSTEEIEISNRGSFDKITHEFEKKTKSESSKNLLSDYTLLGLTYYINGDTNKSIESYQKAKNIVDSGFSNIYRGLGAAYLQKKEYEKSIEYFNKVLLIDTQNAEPFNTLGIIYLLKGDLDQALDFFKKAIALNPDYVEAHNNLGSIYNKKGEYEKSIESHNKAISINPNYADAYYNIANTYKSIKDIDKAIENYKKAISINPEKSESYNNLGTIYAEKKEFWEEAIENYKKATSINPKYSEAFYNLGNVYISKKEFEKAIESYNQAISINPQIAQFHNNLGNVYMLLMKYDIAIKVFKRASSLNPKNAEAYNSFGNAYYLTKKYEKAIEKFKKAISINPKFDIAYNNLGNVYFAKGKKQKAIECYKKALLINPNNRDAKDNLKGF